MKAVQNYLERSYLVGVAHISVEKSKESKLFWIIAILSGFTFTGVLIDSSYRKWKASHISSSLTQSPSCLFLLVPSALPGTQTPLSTLIWRASMMKCFLRASGATFGLQ